MDTACSSVEEGFEDVLAFAIKSMSEAFGLNKDNLQDQWSNSAIKPDDLLMMFDNIDGLPAIHVELIVCGPDPELRTWQINSSEDADDSGISDGDIVDSSAIVD